MSDEMIIDVKIKNNKSAIDELDKTMEGLTSTTKKTSKGVDELGNEVKKTGKRKSELDKVKEGLKGVEKGAKEAKSGVNVLAGGFKSLASAMLPILSVAAVVGFVKKSLDAFEDFEKGMNSIFTLLPKKSAEAEEAMGKKVRNMAKTYGVEMSDATDAIYNALSAGVSEDNVFGFVETGIKASKAGMASLSDSTATLNTIMNNYRSDSLDVNNVSDLLFATIKKGVTSFPELASSIGDVLPSTAAANVSFEQTAATIATLTATMGKGSTAKAGTSMRAMFEELNNSGSKTYKMFKQLNGGVDFKTFMKNGGTVSQALGMIEKKAQSTGKTVADMFMSVESKKAVNILTSNKKVFDENLDEFKNVAGATDEAYEKMNRGWGATTARLKAGMTDVMIGLGDAIAPVAGLIGGALIEALSLVTPAFDLLGQGINSVIKPLSALGEAWGLITGTSSTAGIEETNKKFAELSPLAQQLVKPLAELNQAFNDLINKLIGAFAPATERVQEFFNSITGNTNTKDILVGLVEGVTWGVETITPLLEGLGSWWSTQFNVMLNVVGIVGNFFKGVMEGMGVDTQTLGQFISDLYVITGATFKGFSTAVSTAWGITKPIFDFLAETLGKIIGLLAKVSFEPLQKGASFLSGLLGGKKKNALGTDNFGGGTTTISEQGKELFATPSGLVGISPNSRSEMMLPKGTQIFSNKKTEKIMNMAKNIYNNQVSLPQGYGNSYDINIPISIQQVAQDKIEKIKALRPLITSLIENILSDKESDMAYKWGDM
ncbi:phage tail tape measure protein [Pseudoleptotrichia goodfellowii]|uniref:Phage tail tape measure protein, TP901 family n=1 Tax=Pseudoleptotrichia goodfellowii F0264 TaxID=596323 RepID=D0GNX1_9FUSO|nr:phage tail tape measure protein [Pseudoleptotrichia goodfellowii]EEY34204.1 phage tail tape measure protein, TP901 family [Pseudoleptotrichia goodfellowii F0264]